MIIATLKFHLPSGGIQTGPDLVIVLGSAMPDPLLKVRRRGRLDEDETRTIHRLAHLERTLRVDLQDHVDTVLDPTFHRATQRAVTVAVDLCVLEELAGPHAALELGRCEEIVVGPVALTRSRRPRGGRNGNPHVGSALDERLDERSFAGARRPRDDEQMT